MLINIKLEIAQDIDRNWSAMTQHCSIYGENVHIVQIERVSIYCTYCTKLYKMNEIVEHMPV